MSKKYTSILVFLVVLGTLLTVFISVSDSNFAILNPKGIIAMGERDLIVNSVLVMLLIVIPVLFIFYFFAWKYRAGNPKEEYPPTPDHNNPLEFSWWAILGVIVLVLAILGWKGAHEFDPFQPIQSNVKPITIQVVALEWKWLFIYPEQNIATVNFIEFPEDTPINFELTADAPMNSFWIPELGGQMYAMEGMSTKLHLEAREVGEFRGSAAEISGRGFAGMKFVAKSVSREDFDAWVESVRQSGNNLSLDEYNKLAEQSENDRPTSYASVEENLYDTIIMKYMFPEN